MKRWIWFVAALFISTSVYFTIRYGLRPKPIPVLNPTEFESSDQIGAVVYKRLRQEIRAERVILLGSSADLANYQDVWTGLLKTALVDGLKIDVFFQREGLLQPEHVGAWEEIPFTEAMVQNGALAAQVTARMQVGHLVVVHGLTSEISHLMKDSLSRALDRVSLRPVLAISILSLTLKPEEIDTLKAQCLDPSSEHDGKTRMGCAEVRVENALLKKKLTPGKIWAVMERHGLKEYLIFIHH